MLCFDGPYWIDKLSLIEVRKHRGPVIDSHIWISDVVFVSYSESHVNIKHLHTEMLTIRTYHRENGPLNLNKIQNIAVQLKITTMCGIQFVHQLVSITLILYWHFSYPETKSRNPCSWTSFCPGRHVWRPSYGGGFHWQHAWFNVHSSNYDLTLHIYMYTIYYPP